MMKDARRGVGVVHVVLKDLYPRSRLRHDFSVLLFFVVGGLLLLGVDEAGGKTAERTVVRYDAEPSDTSIVFLQSLPEEQE